MTTMMGKDGFREGVLPYPVPENLLPESARPRGMFPTLTPEDINSLPREGWTGVGVVTVIMSPDNKALILRHVGSAKVTDGAQGFMSEVLKGKFNGNGEVEDVEQIEHTISRALIEELKFKPEDLASLHFTANRRGAWELIPVAVRDAEKNKRALGFVVVLRADNNTVAKINDQLFEGLNNAEIYGGKFTPWHEIGNDPHTPWRDIYSRKSAAEVAMQRNGRVQRVRLPKPDMDRYPKDMRFENGQEHG